MIPISEINSANRFRKDLGDIRPLASSIAEVGLMHHIVVKNGEARNYQLIAGLRRLEACKLLGWKKVPVTILDIEEIITGELHENVVRKDFVMSERIAILEEIERQRLGHRVSKERVANCTPFQNEQKVGRVGQLLPPLLVLANVKYQKNSSLQKLQEITPANSLDYSEKLIAENSQSIAPISSLRVSFGKQSG